MRNRNNEISVVFNSLNAINLKDDFYEFFLKFISVLTIVGLIKFNKCLNLIFNIL